MDIKTMRHLEKYIDISPVISSDMAVFPGDVPFQLNQSLQISKGDPVTLAALTSTLHIGAHTDAPKHYHPQGVDMAATNLHYYIGPCQVLTFQLPRGETIGLRHWRELERRKGVKISEARVLFKTGSYPLPNTWNSDFNAVHPDLIAHFHQLGVSLVGIDTPSIDPASSKTLDAHAAIFRHNMAILEGIVLDQVAMGRYYLIALPLRISDADASPVRAILIPYPNEPDLNKEAFV